MSHLARRWLQFALIVAGVLVFDQVTKRLIVEGLRVGETRRLIPALSPFFQITYSQNTGASFGFLPQAGDLFLLIALVVVIGMFIFYPRIPAEARITRLATAMICGGALGNALDRIEYGHVVDFIHYQIPGVISNVSNLADHAIVLGVILIFIESWLLERRKNQPKPESEPRHEAETNL
ncbi:MAG: signal peptidase II [Anaerolineae bacterium]|nr:signal peptidase II [Anaerolineae bacterium]